MAEGQPPQKRERQDFEQSLDSGSTEAASFDERETTPLARFHHFLHGYPVAAPVIVLAISCAIFGIVANNFFSTFNLSLIIQQVTIIDILGAAQTLVILTAGIDLSVAAIMVLSYMIMARLGVQTDMPAIIAVVIGLAVGLACGLFNGSLVTRSRLLPPVVAVAIWLILLSFGMSLIWAVPIGILAGLALGLTGFGPSLDLRLPPFIVTLGAWSIFFALNLWYSQSETIRSQDIDATAPLLKVFGLRVEILGAQFTLGSFLMIGIFIVLWYVLSWTGWGRSVYAVGDDKEAAELSGIRTDRILISVYGVAGFLCALAGWAAIGRVGAGSPPS
jgi:fructose transport system permease protein